jgi:hypothetical protein
MLDTNYVGLGEAGAGEGDGGGGEGDGDGGGGADGDGDGLGSPEGEAEGLAEGDAVGDAVGDDDGVELHPPARKMYWVFAPLQPRVIPDGCEYQSRIPAGSALTKRFITVLPTCSPYAVMRPPPPFGAVLPTQTPTTMFGL